MADRLLRVNAYTTLDLVDAHVRGHDFEADRYAVVNATTPRTSPDHVRLQVEVDNMDETHMPAHVEELRLSPDEARTLADELLEHAATVEDESEPA